MRMTGQNRMGRAAISYQLSAISYQLSAISPLHNPQRVAGLWRRWAVLGAALIMVFALSGCMLVSGELTSADTPVEGGNLSTSFVSAEGSETRVLETGAAGNVDVITIVSADEGTLTVELLDPAGSVIYAVSSRPREPVTKSGSVPTDQDGRLRYRISATAARNGGLQLLYQRGG